MAKKRKVGKPKPRKRATSSADPVRKMGTLDELRVLQSQVNALEGHVAFNRDNPFGAEIARRLALAENEAAGARVELWRVRDEFNVVKERLAALLTPDQKTMAQVANPAGDYQDVLAEYALSYIELKRQGKVRYSTLAGDTWPDGPF